MLRQQLRLCRVVDAVSPFGSRRPSITQRHFLRAYSRHRSVVSDSPAAAAAKDPLWVMLHLHGRRMDDSFVANAKTVAVSRTSTAENLRVSLGGAPPPAISFLYYDLTTDSVPGEEDGDDDYNDISVDVVAAHSDSVLLRLSNKYCASAAFEDNDYFMYRAGAAGPPSLSLLPDRDFLTKTERGYAHSPGLHSQSTGLLRRGDNDDDLLVVQLELWYNRDARQEMVELCVLRPGTGGMRQWELMEPVPIVHDHAEAAARRRSSGDAVFPIGDRYLCWVDYEDGFFLCDMADDARPKVRYAPLPTEVRGRLSYEESDDDLYRMKYSMKMEPAGPSKVRFVSIDPHCCCGAPCRSTCAQSHFAFTVTTWTMDLTVDMDSPLTWVKDGEIDCEEVWTLPEYEGLPRANLECPVISLDDTNVISFLVSNCHFVATYEEHKVWMIQLNMKTKKLLSVVQFSNDDLWRAYHRLPARLQY